MEKQEQTAFNLKQVIEQAINPELVINSDEFNNDFTSSKLFQYYTDKGATLITGLTDETTAPTETGFNEQKIKPNKLTTIIEIENELLKAVSNDSFIELLINELKKPLKKAIQLKYLINSKSDYSKILIAQFGSIDLIIDNVTLKSENKIRLIINLYIDVLVKE